MMSITVVLIDDDPDDLDLMKDAIAIVNPGAQCIAFMYPEEAMKTLLARKLPVLPQYIFIDINMPRVSGDKCLRTLRNEKDFDDIVISLYSTSMPRSVKDALHNAGADYTFEKPVRLSTYTDILKQILSMSREKG